MKITQDTIAKVYKAQPIGRDTAELLGYELVDELFVDSSGFGQDGEAALTTGQLEQRLKHLLAEHGTLHAFITGAGMFQVYIGLFTKTGQKRAKRLSRNVLLIDRDDGRRVVRLYDTDIATDNGDGTLTLNTGGYNTVTTSKWLNRLTDVSVYRKNWVMHVGSYGQDDPEFVNDTITVKGALTV